MSDFEALKLVRDLIMVHEFVETSILEDPQNEDLLDIKYSLEDILYEIYWARE